MNMRPIKFRAWDEINKKMVNFFQGEIKVAEDGNLWGNYLKLMQFTGLLDRNGKEIWEGDVLERQIIGHKKVTASESTSAQEYTRSTVLRFQHIVKWSDKNAGFITQELPTLLESGSRAKMSQKEIERPLSGLCSKFWEIIGNIYSNPELLNHEKD